MQNIIISLSSIKFNATFVSDAFARGRHVVSSWVCTIKWLFEWSYFAHNRQDNPPLAFVFIRYLYTALCACTIAAQLRILREGGASRSSTGAILSFTASTERLSRCASMLPDWPSYRTGAWRACGLQSRGAITTVRKGRWHVYEPGRPPLLLNAFTTSVT